MEVILPEKLRKEMECGVTTYHTRRGKGFSLNGGQGAKHHRKYKEKKPSGFQTQHPEANRNVYKETELQLSIHFSTCGSQLSTGMVVDSREKLVKELGT